MDFTKKMPWTVTELQNLYEDTSSGHWFDKDTMRFFKTRLPGDFRRLDDKTALFISTEQGPMDGSKRRATVRIATIVDQEREGGDMVSKVEIETLGDFNQLHERSCKLMPEASHEISTFNY